MSTLWGGRFKQTLDDAFNRFNQSLPFDRRLFKAEIDTTQAFITGLHASDILTLAEYHKLCEGLKAIESEVTADPQIIDKAIAEGIEDIHSFVESQLVKRLGDWAYKANTGRSRNEQIATCLRLWLKTTISNIIDKLKQLQYALAKQAEKHQSTVLIGYTHMQRAQPVTWGHLLMAYVEMLERDRTRLDDVYARMDVCPLGAGALAGNAWQIDRLAMVNFLGFSEVSANSIDTVSDRDFVIEFNSAASLIAMHLSRLAEDLILYSTTEFDMVEMSDQVTTGSSLMPQKKNPDAMELIRGKTGRIYGNLISLLNLMKGLPSCYNKDLQEDKEPLFDTVDTLIDGLTVATACIDTIKIKSARYPEYGYILATEIADYLAYRGKPFRQAHHIVGHIVQYALNNNQTLDQLSLNEFKQFSDLFEPDIYEMITIESAIRHKDVRGGTNQDQVANRIADYLK